MRVYYEAVEQVQPGMEGEFVRLDVTDSSNVERSLIQDALRDLMSGRDCNFYQHDCRHDENGSCSLLSF